MSGYEGRIGIPVGGWRTHHAFQAMKDVDRTLVKSIGATMITASLPSGSFSS